MYRSQSHLVYEVGLNSKAQRGHVEPSGHVEFFRDHAGL